MIVPLTLIKKHKYFLIFTFLYLVLGLLLYKDFGITYDEKTEYDAGKYLLKYYRTPTTQDYMDDLGKFNPNRIDNWQLPIFSHYSRIYPMLVTLLNPNFYWEWFHFQNIVSGYFLFLFTYIVFHLFYKKSAVALIGPVLLFLTAVITGHVPANPKDVPFATIMLLGVLGIYFFSAYIPKEKSKRECYLLSEILFLGVVFGTAQSLRTVGLTLLITYVLYGLFLSLSGKDVGILLLKTISIGLISLITWVVLVPFVGTNVFKNIWSILVGAASFPHWDDKVLYFGDFLYRNQRPWHYLFVHLLIQLPLFTLFGLITGIWFFITRKIKYQKNHVLVVIVITVVLNLVLYLVVNPVVYNGLRHFLYIVVLLTILAGFLLIGVYEKLSEKNRLVLKAGIGFYCLFTLLRMINLHPYEYIYYNELIGGLKGAEGRFEMDYWGAAYKEASIYVAKKAQKHNLEGLKVATCDNHFVADYYSQFRFTRIYASKDSDVHLCDTFKSRFRDVAGEVPYTLSHPLVKTINREGVAIFNIYALPKYVEFFE